MSDRAELMRQKVTSQASGSYKSRKPVTQLHTQPISESKATKNTRNNNPVKSSVQVGPYQFLYRTPKPIHADMAAPPPPPKEEVRNVKESSMKHATKRKIVDITDWDTNEKEKRRISQRTTRLTPISDVRYSTPETIREAITSSPLIEELMTEAAVQAVQLRVDRQMMHAVAAKNVAAVSTKTKTANAPGCLKRASFTAQYIEKTLNAIRSVEEEKCQKEKTQKLQMMPMVMPTTHFPYKNQSIAPDANETGTGLLNPFSRLDDWEKKRSILAEELRALEEYKTALLETKNTNPDTGLCADEDSTSKEDKKKHKFVRWAKDSLEKFENTNKLPSKFRSVRFKAHIQKMNATKAPSTADDTNKNTNPEQQKSSILHLVQ